MLLRYCALLFAIATAQAAGGVERLRDAWVVALRDAPAVEASDAQSAAAGHDLLATTAARYPAASLRTGYTVRSSDSRFLATAPGPGGPTAFELPFAQQNSAALSVRAAAPLYTGGQVGSAIAAADARHDATIEAAEWTRMQTRMRVAQAYVRLLQAQRAVGVAAQLLASAQQRLADVEKRVQSQRGTDRDVAARRLEVSQAEFGLLQSQNDLAAALLEYGHALGRPGECDSRLVEPSLTWLTEPLASLTASAVACRPDVAETSEAIAAHRHDAASWAASRRPKVSAEVALDYQENRFQTPQAIASAGVFLDWAWFDAGKRRHNASAAASRAAAARADQRDQQLTVAAEVLDAWNARAESVAAERVAQERLTYANEQQRWVSERLTSGLALESEAADAQAALAEAEAAQFYARTDRFLAQTRLRFVTGRLGDDVGVEDAPSVDGADRPIKDTPTPADPLFEPTDQDPLAPTAEPVPTPLELVPAGPA